jgi:Tol biopolymer transport system component
VGREDTGEGDRWDVDLASGIFSRLTTHAGLDSDPSWSPDERSLAFTALAAPQHAPGEWNTMDIELQVRAPWSA